MLKSQIIDKLHEKYSNLKVEDIESIFDNFIKILVNNLKEGKNIEIRGFGTISKKLNKEKFVRNPKTNEKLFKKNSFKLHFKIGKILHRKINPINEEE
ncbi:MAG: hypothetical protein CBD97_01840 [Pelagibacteraceae bacterium TMED237]|nr:MAG: hypothetical protein CBD97_01840 [Pelagibacteraceae bacterium TMED237]|tara:strand:- start:6346 stop:6639 length:294 start_codon:yes stop_codon:yes gene_type:complete